MPLKKIFCPNCGQETKINVDRDFSFCLSCGNKIVLKKQEPVQIQNQKEDNRTIEKSETITDEIDKKLEEVSFYYKLSEEKNEMFDHEREPFYYLKAQDVLLDLSEQYPEDYRIWWEWCKPLDFSNPLSGADIYGNYYINEEYFNKALDRADLSEKKKIIDEHDRYVESKKSLLEKKERQRRAAEEERKKKEELLQRAEEERLHQEALEKQRIQQKAEQKNREISKIENPKLWESLYAKDYSRIDATYFSLPSIEGRSYTGVFKVVSNILYLTALRIEGNNIFKEQSMPVKFDESGHAVRFDNSPIKIKGLTPPKDILEITVDGNVGLQVNGITLTPNLEFVLTSMKRARKPILSFTKIFI